MKLKDIPWGTPNLVNVIVEVSAGARNRYVYDEKMDTMRFLRMLTPPLQYPGDYGFIPQTYVENGNPLDVIVLMSEAAYPGTVVQARPIGVLKMTEDGILEYKILCVPVHDPAFENITEGEQLSAKLNELSTFFEAYKRDEGKVAKITGWFNSEEARRTIDHCHRLFQRKFSVS